MAKARLHKLVLEDLAKSGLDAHDAERMQLKFIEPDEMAKLFKRAHVAAYEIPYFDEHGKLTGYSRYKLLEELVLDKRKAKYLQLPGSKPHFYFPPFLDWKKINKDTSQPLVITEGEKKAAAACKLGIPTIGLGGVWNWLTQEEEHD